MVYIGFVGANVRAYVKHNWHVGVLALLLSAQSVIFLSLNFPWIKKVWVVGAAWLFRIVFGIPGVFHLVCSS
jgi:hypothetical protein